MFSIFIWIKMCWMLEQFNSDVCHTGNLETAEGNCIFIVQSLMRLVPPTLWERSVGLWPRWGRQTPAVRSQTWGLSAWLNWLNWPLAIHEDPNSHRPPWLNVLEHNVVNGFAVCYLLYSPNPRQARSRNHLLVCHIILLGFSYDYPNYCWLIYWMLYKESHWSWN